MRVEREGKRWEDMERKEGGVEQRWDRLRDEGEKSKKNKSGVPYNMISLRYMRDGARATAESTSSNLSCLS